MVSRQFFLNSVFFTCIIGILEASSVTCQNPQEFKCIFIAGFLNKNFLKCICQRVKQRISLSPCSNFWVLLSRRNNISRKGIPKGAYNFSSTLHRVEMHYQNSSFTDALHWLSSKGLARWPECKYYFVTPSSLDFCHSALLQLVVTTHPKMEHTWHISFYKSKQCQCKRK